MSKFKFMGDPKGGETNDPKSIEMLGYSFDLMGKAVVVDDAAAAKLRNNSHFEEVGKAKADPLPSS